MSGIGGDPGAAAAGAAEGGPVLTGAHDVLMVVDVQRDFCPGGALGVAGGDEVVPVINELAAEVRPLGLHPRLASSRSRQLLRPPGVPGRLLAAARRAGHAGRRLVRRASRCR